MALFNILYLFPLLQVLPSSTTTLYVVLTDCESMPCELSKDKSAWHSWMIDAASIANTDHRQILYHYSHVIHGFLASMTLEEAEKISMLPEVMAVEEDKLQAKLHMTRVPSFLGLTTSYDLWPNAGFGDNAIIGFVDNGIWLENLSFYNDGMLPLEDTRKWRGICEKGSNFSTSDCKKKIIGAHFCASRIEALFGRQVEDDVEYRSPQDATGHGSVVASIAAGVEIDSVSILGFAYGIVQGIALKAQIASLLVEDLYAN